MPRFHLVTLFPEFFESPLSTALMGRAREAGIVECSFHDPRQFSTDKHRHVDDRPYGGGPGMVMQGEPLARALRSIERPGRMLFMAPGGRPLTQDMVRDLAHEEDLTIVCGRYEGIDARLLQLFPLEPVSVGDIVLNGGESAALSVLEAVARLMPGFMGKEESGDDESFSHGLLEYPHYTRPESLEGLSVPEVLQSGDHARIAQWRRQESVRATLRMRPEMLNEAPLYREDVQTLAETPRDRPGRNLSFCLVHYPVSLGPKKIGASSLTNLDIHDIARISRSYAMGSFYPVTPLRDQLRVLEEILRHWTRGPGGTGNADRAQALGLVQPATSLEEAVAHMTAQHGTRPRLVASSAVWPAKGKASQPGRMPMTPRDVRRWCDQGPVMLCLGTAQGLAPEVLEQCEGTLRPVRFLGYNHLSVRSAAAILADRILGDYY
ncbi:tRNA (guanine-N(1)-)-methyltransferase [bioreactor metagenome]|uniref:tRNA (guanine-N(1)-)-methyltransferase n=2 Tax=root TaxID=1 RepID=A0A212KCT9_9BACT|nr:tRNA (guanosine(37)-N1)-methyltransferase TrmD [Desulfovibrio desulfuricans]MCB6541581.1 tRNA (guanosine(37)-N1)-methyltransferase TrmD [Desulfovibrio desulfuricans]MCB6552662.1 tRNA (guanosine(37)-N1)-methyltransferase TrmD [Desulfovibrio desulfuricans]MCB6564412.1 tRNA (guanosine(37)-N1)-methyltransferase TrmD [Desulfovibrio desulfuricans]MCB7345687.1 tRNA (guanosine(37)-N1)-methyltransferase TrmD [Desulfovibrio desulfuricans]MCQ4861189.1 tRNA (guanosine(37)-N1)-methyltransferase TrmD [De